MNRLKHAFSALSLLLFLGGQTFVSAKLKFPFKVKINYTAPIEKLEFHDTIAGVYSQLHNEIKNINIGATNPAFNGTVLVAHKGKLIFEESYGVSNRAFGLKNTPKTPHPNRIYHQNIYRNFCFVAGAKRFFRHQRPCAKIHLGISLCRHHH